LIVVIGSFFLLNVILAVLSEEIEKDKEDEKAKLEMKKYEEFIELCKYFKIDDPEVQKEDEAIMNQSKDESAQKSKSLPDVDQNSREEGPFEKANLGDSVQDSPSIEKRDSVLAQELASVRGNTENNLSSFEQTQGLKHLNQSQEPVLPVPTAYPPPSKESTLKIEMAVIPPEKQ
jgi:hypothetical protein